MLRGLTSVLVAVGLTLSGGLTVVSANPALVRAKQLEDEARVHLRQRQYPEGIGKARGALALREQVVGGMHPDLVPTLRLLGDLLFQRGGASREARPVLERLVAIHDRAHGPDDVRVLPHLMTLGTVVRINGDLLGARSVFERAAAVAQRAHGPESPAVAGALGALGFVLTHTGKHAEAREVLERALRIEERSFGPDSPQALKTGEYLALALETSGEYAAARPLLERAVRSWERRAPGGPGLADRLSALAQILLATGDRLRARELAERATAMTEARGGSPSARAQGVLADVLESEGKLVEARPLRERAVAIQEKAYGGNFPWVAEANNDFADILVATGDHATARSHYERALSIGRRLSAPEQVWRATLGLGRIHERDGLLAEAVGHYRTAMTTVEGLAAQFARQESRRQYLETNQRLAVYDALARALLRLHELEPRKGYDREAAGILDAKRARIAAEALTAVRPTPPDPQVRAALDQIRAREDQALALEGALRQEQAKPLDQQDTRRIQELTVLLAQTKSEYLDKVRDLIERSPRSRTLVLHSHSVDPRLLAKFADRLPAGTLAVQYFAAADALYIFLVGPGGLFQVKKHAVTQTALYALIEEYRAHVALGARSFLSWSDDGSPVYRREVTRFKQVTLDLGRHLLGPIERELETHRDLVLIPNDALLYLPIHALGRPSSDEQIRFLAETHTVSYATQLEIVDVLGPAGAATVRPLLAMGNPDGGLPWASDEIRALERLRPTVMAFVGPDATKVRFLSLTAQHRPDLHLATHGVFDPLRPERSYLRMAGADEPSQRLTIREIAGLQLTDGLAILSACDTALGETVPGAGLITLAAAFSQAGTRSIVASLWRVNDQATRDFMVTFHRELASSGRAQALRTAQLALMKNPRTAHPYYWAPFLLIGAR